MASTCKFARFTAFAFLVCVSAVVGLAGKGRLPSLMATLQAVTQQFRRRYACGSLRAHIHPSFRESLVLLVSKIFNKEFH